MGVAVHVLLYAALQGSSVGCCSSTEVVDFPSVKNLSRLILSELYTILVSRDVSLRGEGYCLDNRERFALRRRDAHALVIVRCVYHTHSNALLSHTSRTLGLYREKWFCYMADLKTQILLLELIVLYGEYITSYMMS